MSIISGFEAFIHLWRLSGVTPYSMALNAPAEATRVALMGIWFSPPPSSLSSWPLKALTRSNARVSSADHARNLREAYGSSGMVP